jgi:drug/metabolite transporter (DMT)-like permease
MRKSRRAFWGLFLIVVGAALLAKGLGSGIPAFDQIWPAILVLGGVAALVCYVLGDRRNPGQVFLGLAAALSGVFFFFITLGPLQYEHLGEWWPTFVLIGSVAWLGQWVATGFRDWGALFLALVALVIGGAGVAVALELLGPQTRESLPGLWPVLLIVGGLMVFLRAALGRRQ